MTHARKPRRKVEITAEVVRRLFDYDPITGVLTWRIQSHITVKPGTPAGTLSAAGYLIVSIGGKKYRGHRLIWLHQFGRWPTKFIDHINGNPGDNRLANLRDVSCVASSANTRAHRDSASGLKGVFGGSDRKTWQAKIQVNHVRYCLGSYSTKEEAHEVYCLAADLLNGAYANHG